MRQMLPRGPGAPRDHRRAPGTSLWQAMRQEAEAKAAAMLADNGIRPDERFVALQLGAQLALAAATVLVPLAIATNCVNLLLELRQVMLRPSGLDEENQIAVIPIDWI